MVKYESKIEREKKIKFISSSSSVVKSKLKCRRPLSIWINEVKSILNPDNQNASWLWLYIREILFSLFYCKLINDHCFLYKSLDSWMSDKKTWVACQEKGQETKWINSAISYQACSKYCTTGLTM